jgi:putative spermidine/putrescine transport system permease protein
MAIPSHKGLSLSDILSLLPAAAVLLVFFAGAFVMAAAQSFGYAPQYGINEFLTMRHYAALMGSDDFWISAALTFYYAIVPTLLGAAVSIVLALILAKRFKGKIIAEFLYKIPMVVPYLVGVGLVILLFANGGLFARLFYAAGMINSPSEFPRLLQTGSGIGVMLVYLWKQIPFMTLVLYSNLMVIGRQDEESALLLGANRFQIFWNITLPKLVPSLMTAMAIVFAFNFGSFEVPFILGGGHPNTLPVEAWRLFDSPDYTNRPAAMAVVILTVVFSLTGLLASFSFYRILEKKRGRA